MGWKLGVPARALPSFAATRWGSHGRGVWTDCVESEGQSASHRRASRPLSCASTCVREDVVYVYALRRRVELLAPYRNYSSLLVGGSTCAGRAAAAAAAAAARAATQQQPTREICSREPLSVRGAEGADHSLDHSRISCWPSKRRRRSWASHSTWTTPPTGRPATAHPCARRWPCLLGRRRE